MPFSDLKYSPYLPVSVERVCLPSKPNYYRFASRETALCREEPWISYLVDHGCTGFVDLPSGNIYEYFIEEPSAMAVFQHLAAYMENNWKEHVGRFGARKEELVKAARAVSEASVAGDRDSVHRAFEAYCRTCYDFCEYIWSPWAVIHCLEPVLAEKFPQALGPVIALDEPIEYLKMQADLFRLSPDKMEEKYAWVNVYSPHDRPFTAQDFERMRGETDAGKLEEEAEKRKEIGRAFRAFLDSIADPSLRIKAEIVHRYAFMKTDRIDAWRKAMFELRPFYQHLCSLQKGLAMQDAVNLSTYETTSLLCHDQLPPLSHLKLRSQSRVLYFFHDGKLEVAEKRAEIERVRELVEPVASSLVRGTIACRGIASGPARVILHSEDLAKVREGDIFIAKYTFPTFTPYMLKCRAILTDEGGITSHAAIIAREYGIPCLVGTKHATKAFKDGEEVEVNAEEGLARKVETGGGKPNPLKT